MTKNEAVFKIKKLLVLAKQPGSEEEGKNALRAAKRLMKQHNISEQDLLVSVTSAAFDDLIGELGAFISKSKKEVPAVVGDVLERIKKSTSDQEKNAAIFKLRDALKLASMIWGGEKGFVGDLNKVVQSVLTRYEISG